MINEPAFPRAIYSGMTLRDYFATKAMQNMDWKIKPYDNLQSYAELVYAIADAMMKAREA